jgi:hypothetical protein
MGACGSRFDGCPVEQAACGCSSHSCQFGLSGRGGTGTPRASDRRPRFGRREVGSFRANREAGWPVVGRGRLASRLRRTGLLMGSLRSATHVRLSVLSAAREPTHPTTETHTARQLTALAARDANSAAWEDWRGGRGGRAPSGVCWRLAGATLAHDVQDRTKHDSGEEVRSRRGTKSKRGLEDGKTARDKQQACVRDRDSGAAAAEGVGSFNVGPGVGLPKPQSSGSSWDSTCPRVDARRETGALGWMD